jgi:proteasome lid subunit RPN8/RPN11
MKDTVIPSYRGNMFLSGNSPGEPIVTINKTSLDYIKEFAKQDTSKERGGVLVGTIEKLNKTFKVAVLGAIEGKFTDASSVSLKFTHKTWNYIHEVKDQEYPTLKIVGWFHTHPGLGVFLSHHDLFIHQNFFNEPWQVALVVDPLHDNKVGLFYWEKNSIIEAGTKKEQGISGGEEYVGTRGSKMNSIKAPVSPYLLRAFLLGFLTCALLLLGFQVCLMKWEKNKSAQPSSQSREIEKRTTITGLKQFFKTLRERKDNIKPTREHNKEER